MSCSVHPLQCRDPLCCRTLSSTSNLPRWKNCSISKMHLTLLCVHCVQHLLLHSILASAQEPFFLSPLSHFSTILCFSWNHWLSWDYLTAWAALSLNNLSVCSGVPQPFSTSHPWKKKGGEGTRVPTCRNKGRCRVLGLPLLCDPPCLEPMALTTSLSSESLSLHSTINNALEQCDPWQAVSDDIVRHTQLLKQPGCNHRAVPTERHLANEIPFSHWSVLSM